MAFLVGYAQLGAAFGSAALDDVAAIGRRHTIHKTVLVAALTLGWLVGAFHFSIKFIALKNFLGFLFWEGKGKEKSRRLPKCETHF